MSPKSQVRLAGCGLAAATAAAYANSFGGPFILDDTYATTRNASIRHLWRLRTALSPPSVSGVGGRPVLNLSFAINYAISRDAVWSYHALNLAIHIGAALLLFGIIRRTIEGLGGTGPQGSAQSAPVLLAFLAALLWALHPLQTESVTYISERAESLMGLFYLLALYCFIRGAEFGTGEGAAGSELRNSQSGRQDRRSSGSRPEATNELRYCELGRPEGARRFHPFGTRLRLSFSALRAPSPAAPSPVPNSSRVQGVWFGLSWISCLFGMGTKEVMVTAPVIVLFYDRTFVAGSFREALKKRLGYYVGLAATWLVLWRLMGGIHLRMAGFGLGVSGAEYAATECGVILRYLGLALWPHPLVLDYNLRYSATVLNSAGSFLVVVILAAASAYLLLRRRGSEGMRAAGFLGCSFFILLSPTSSFVPVALQPMAENRMYLPLAALVVAAVLGVRKVASGGALAICLGLAAVLGVATAVRNSDYATALGIWEDTLSKSPNSERAHSNLGAVLWRLDRPAEALAQLEEALKLAPNDALCRMNLARLLAEMEQVDEALRQFRAVVDLQPDSAGAHFDFATSLARAGKLRDAIPEYEEALKLNPANAEAHSNFALALEQIGRPRDAEAECRAAIRLDPELAEAHVNLGIALAALNRRSEAAAEYETAIRITPASAQAHNNLGILLLDAGRTQAAMTEFATALGYDPRYASAHFYLGKALVASGRPAEAAAQLEAALRINPGLSQARDMLASLRSSPR